MQFIFNYCFRNILNNYYARLCYLDIYHNRPEWLSRGGGGGGCHCSLENCRVVVGGKHGSGWKIAMILMLLCSPCSTPNEHDDLHLLRNLFLRTPINMINQPLSQAKTCWMKQHEQNMHRANWHMKRLKGQWLTPNFWTSGRLIDTMIQPV